ncbi:unnamed protein product, partial [Gadus morhua 'NCC']
MHHQQPGGPLLPVVAALEKTPPQLLVLSLLEPLRVSFKFPWWKAPELECAEDAAKRSLQKPGGGAAEGAFNGGRERLSGRMGLSPLTQCLLSSGVTPELSVVTYSLCPSKELLSLLRSCCQKHLMLLFSTRLPPPRRIS